MARAYVLDWRGVTKTRDGGPAPYTPGDMAKVFGAVGSILALVRQAISEDEGFFARNGNAST